MYSRILSFFPPPRFFLFSSCGGRRGRGRGRHRGEQGAVMDTCERHRARPGIGAHDVGSGLELRDQNRGLPEPSVARAGSPRGRKRTQADAPYSRREATYAVITSGEGGSWGRIG